MKKFEKPIIELENLEIMDIIATSGCADDLCFTDGMDCPDHI